MIVCLCAFVCTRAGEWSPSTLPSPKAIGQEYYVSNPDAVLSTHTVQTLNELCSRLKTNTSAEMAVVAIDTYAPSYDAHSVALQLFNLWGIGGEDRHTGVLLFLSRSNREIELITGKGIEGILTDVRCGQILDANIAYLSKNDFDTGILHICENIESMLMQDENRSELLLGWSPKKPAHNTGWIVILLFVLLVIVLWVWTRHKKRQGQLKRDRNVVITRPNRDITHPEPWRGNSRASSWGGGSSAGGGAGRKF